MLQQAEIDLKTLNIEKLRTKYEFLTKLAKKEVRDLNQKFKILQQYFSPSISNKKEEKLQEKENTQTL